MLSSNAERINSLVFIAIHIYDLTMQRYGFFLKYANIFVDF